MEAESPCAASDLAVARRELLSGNHRELDPVGLRQTWLDLHESWLIDKADEIGIADASGFAIVGVGGLGRRELLPYSDLDVLLLHDGKPADILRPVADRLWYPLWDANIRLDHSVRTVSEALTIANSDLMAALGMLEARHIAGDQQLSFALIDGVRRQWRNGIRSRMGELVEMTYARWRRCGRIAQRAEPDLKLGRGGLRDVQLLDALALAQLIDRHGIGHTDLPAGSLDGAYRTLLDVRTELHRVSGRGRDHLLAQFADEISAALGFGDRFDLARTLIEGWTAHDLAAHIVLRERDLVAGLCIVLPGPFQRFAERRRARLAQSKDFTWLVARIRSGPPMGFFRIGWVRTLANLNEFFVHHEDVRRASGRGPRSLTPEMDAALWRNVRRGSHFLSRRLHGCGLEIEWVGTGKRVRVRSGEPTARLTGPPGELLLYVFGRRAVARVEVSGPLEAIAAVHRTHFGM